MLRVLSRRFPTKRTFLLRTLSTNDDNDDNNVIINDNIEPPMVTKKINDINVDPSSLPITFSDISRASLAIKVSRVSLWK